MEDYPYLDDPLPVQWVMWMKDILTGDWGYSYIASQSTIEMFQQRMPTTVFIVLWAIFIGLLDRRAPRRCTAPTSATRGSTVARASARSP